LYYIGYVIFDMRCKKKPKKYAKKRELPGWKYMARGGLEGC
jgi:hypothetical protein